MEALATFSIHQLLFNVRCRYIILFAVANCCCGFSFSIHQPHQMFTYKTHPPQTANRSLHILHHSSGSDNDGDGMDIEEKTKNKEKEPVGLTYDELMQDPELREREMENSIKRRKSLFFGQNISQAVTTTGWLFIIVGAILNSLGYAYVQSPSGGISIGTLDERDFQREIMKERKRDREKEVQNVVIPISRIENTNKHIFRWLEYDIQQNA